VKNYALYVRRSASSRTALSYVAGEVLEVMTEASRRLLGCQSGGLVRVYEIEGDYKGQHLLAWMTNDPPEDA